MDPGWPKLVLLRSQKVLQLFMKHMLGFVMELSEKQICRINILFEHFAPAPGDDQESKKTKQRGGLVEADQQRTQSSFKN